MSEQIKAYVPEFLMTDGKQENAVRVCREDCFIVDPADRFRILGWRTDTPVTAQHLTAARVLPTSELHFLESALTRSRRVLLMGRDRRPFLVFGELLPTTGILTVLSPYADAADVARMLHRMGRTDFAVTPSLGEISHMPSPEDDALYEQLCELFFYTDRMFAPAAQIGLRTRTHLIANFAGCVLDDVAVPLDSLACSDAEQDRLIAFLLCAFLSLRTQDGGVSARTDATEPPLLRYRIEPIAEPKKTSSEAVFPFLSLPTFQRFAVLTDENGVRALEAYLHPANHYGRLCASVPHLIGLRLVAC